jgi:hypothetical protein
MNETEYKGPKETCAVAPSLASAPEDDLFTPCQLGNYQYQHDEKHQTDNGGHRAITSLSHYN